MRKIDYSKIKWNAATNWEFCGSNENLKEVWNRASECRGVRLPIEEFGYSKPTPGYAYEKGDVVTYTGGDHPMLAVVDAPVNPNNGYFCVRQSNGCWLQIHPRNLASQVSMADIPEELVRLARAEAGKPLDYSKCPLKNPGACMKEV